MSVRRRTSKKRGICPLCGAGGWLDHEHIIPRWASKVLLARPGRAPGRVVTTQWSKLHPEGRTYVGELIEQKVWACVECNRAMGKQIEEPAIPVVTPLLRGTSLSLPLSRGAQETIARWLTKITLLLPLVHLPPGPLRRQDWDFLRTRGRPAPTTNIWIGLYGQMDFDTRSRHDEIGFASKRTGKIENGAILTATLGALVAKALVYPWTNAERLPPEVVAFHPDLRDYLIPIWPSQERDVVYPPLRRFDRARLLGLEASGWVDQRRPPPWAPHGAPS